MADQATISRIGDLLKNTYSDSIVEQQNMATVTRKLFTKAKAVRLGGDHYELGIRVGGNRAGVGARLSDDPLPVAGRQQNKKFKVYDRGVFGVIKVYDKDVENALSNKEAFASHLEDEISGVVRDVMKTMNIDTFMDGSGILATVKADTVNTNTFVGDTGSAFGQFGTRYLQVGDLVEIVDPTFTTYRTPANGLSVIALDPTTRTVTLSGNVTLTAGDIVVRQGTANKTYIGLHLASDNGSGISFQTLSRGTYPQVRGNVIAAGGAGLNEGHLQNLLSAIETASGEEADQILVGTAQWNAYVALGQSLKRYTEMKLDRGFTSLEYNGIPLTKDVDCPPMCVYAFKREHVQNGVCTPLSWMDRDGSTLKWTPGYAAYTAVVREYGNYVYAKPNATGRIEGLAVSAADLR